MILIGGILFFAIMCTVGAIVDDSSSAKQTTRRPASTATAGSDDAPFGASYVANRYKHNLRLLAIEYGCKVQHISTKHITDGSTDINFLEVAGIYLLEDFEIREAIKEGMLEDGITPTEGLNRVPGKTCDNEN